jgi:ankyrin repeat protein
MTDSIYEAIKNNSIEDVNRLLAQNLDFVGDGGWNPLHAACKEGNLTAVESILRYIQENGNAGFDIDSEFECIDLYSDYRGTALTEALVNSNNDIVKLLIVNGANVNATYYNQDTDCPEWFLGEYDLATDGGVAWWLSDEELFNLCLTHGLEIDATDHHDKTALIYAVESSNAKRVLQLLKNGANANQYYRHEYMGEIPLLVNAVVIHGKQKTERSFDVVASLLKHGASISAQCLQCDHETVIDIVLDQGDEDLIKLFGLSNIAEKIEINKSKQPM